LWAKRALKLMDKSDISARGIRAELEMVLGGHVPTETCKRFVAHLEKEAAELAESEGM
jgi:hypothetical protein